MKDDVKNIVRSGLFLAIAVVFQLVGKNIPQINQYFVGPVINAILIIATYSSGIWWGVAIGVLTPLTAWILGQLAQPLAPFIPFIMAGNAIFVVCFGVLRKNNWGKYLGYLIGAFLKFGFLYFSAIKLVYLFKINLPPAIIKKLAIIMGVPQLLTALVGGAFAIVIIQMMEKRNIKLN